MSSICSIQDLRLMLGAIEHARGIWRETYNQQLGEALAINDPQTEEEYQKLVKQVLTSSPVRAEYEKLIALYGCVGAQSTEYIKALEAA